MKQVNGPGQLINEMRVSQAEDPKGIEADAFTVGTEDEQFSRQQTSSLRSARRQDVTTQHQPKPTMTFKTQ